jgi:hypothetical protein
MTQILMITTVGTVLLGLAVALAAAVGWSAGWLRQRPDHPLRFLVLPNGFVRYTAGHIRESANRNLRQKESKPWQYARSG